MELQLCDLRESWEEAANELRLSEWHSGVSGDESDTAMMVDKLCSKSKKGC